MSDYSEARIEKCKLQLEEAKAAGIGISHMLLGENEVAEYWDILEADVDVFDSADKLSDGIYRKNVARRRTTTVPLDFGNGIHLAVGIFHLTAEQKLETGVYLDEKTMNLVKSKTRHVKQPTISDTMSLSRIVGDDEAGATSNIKKETVDPEKIKLIKNIGGMNIELDKAELEKFKRIDDPGLHIIGFKPMQYLKWSHHVGATHFLLPNNDLISGSATMYRALLSRCLAKNVFILARYVLKKNTMPKLVALVPQRKGDPESDETDVEKQFYEGFHLVHLPFAEDKRNLKSKLEGDWPAATDAQVKAAESFVNKLTTAYSPTMYCNPVLQKHYWVLEGLATDNDDLGDRYNFDQIKPYFERIDHAKNEAKDFEKQLP
uniref:Ku domain-containing protein n=1 Tax=Panagrolaimus superbus TaxID=310955 RepID=A0A914Y1V7_9BILA